MNYKALIFDLGGVIITIDQQEAIRRFRQLGLADAERRLDPYVQSGIFGELEAGIITADDFRRELSLLIGRNVNADECAYAWQGYAKDVPQRNLETLTRLRQQGYRVLLLSNTNPYMMQWAESDRFDGHGHPLSAYLDRCYLSYQMRLMKPSAEIFRHVLETEQLRPEETLFVDDGPLNIAAAQALGMHTLCPQNGQDWTEELMGKIKE